MTDWTITWTDPIAGGTFSAGTVRSIAPKPTTEVAQRLLRVIYESERPLTKAEWLDAADVHDVGVRKYRKNAHESINNFVRNGAVLRLANGTYRRAA